MGWASFYDKACGLVTLRICGPFFGLFPGLIGRPEVGPALAGQPLGLGRGARPRPWRGRRRSAPPGSARPSNTGGPGVLRIFEQPVGETLLGAGGLLAHDAGNQPHAGVDQRQRRDLAAGQHVIAERDFLELARRDQPLVDALEAAADDDRAGAAAPARRRAPASAARRAGSSAGAGAVVVRHAHRARAASTSAFITMPGPPPAGVSSTVRCLSVACVADVDGVERPEPAPAPCRRGSAPSGPGNISGKNREHAGAPHRHCFVTSPRSRPAARRRCGRAARSIFGTVASVNGSISGVAAAVRRDLDDVAGAEIMHRRDGADRRAVRASPREADRSAW